MLDTADNRSVYNESTCNYTDITLYEENILYVYIFPSACALGIAFNILNLIVLSHKSFRLSTYTYLRMLAVSDTITLAIGSCIGVSRCTECHGLQQTYYWRRFYEIYIYLPLNNMSGTLSVWLTVTLAVERYVYTKYPIRSKILCTRQTARRVIVILAMASILINSGYIMSYEINDCNEIQPKYSAGDVMYNLDKSNSWVKATFANYAPSIALIILSVLLIHQVSRTQPAEDLVRFQNHVRIKREQMHRRLAMMVLIVIVIFLLGNIPIVFASPSIARPLFQDETLSSTQYRTYRLVVNCLELFMYTFNFIIYCASNKKFRQVLYRKVGYHTRDVTVTSED